MDSCSIKKQQQAAVGTVINTRETASQAKGSAVNRETSSQSDTDEDSGDPASDQSVDSQDREISQHEHDQTAEETEEDQLIADAVMDRVLKER